MSELEVDVARESHRSACEEKRRRAFWNGVAFGIVLGGVVVIIISLAAGWT